MTAGNPDPGRDHGDGDRDPGREPGDGSDADVLAAALAWLAAHGPASDAEVLAALDLADDWTPADLRDVLFADDDADDGHAFPLLDGRLCHLGALLDGVTLTHRITAEEREAGVVASSPDLPALALLERDRSVPITATPNGPAGVLTRDTDGVSGPPGWLPDDEVLVLRVVDGHVEVSGLPQVPEPDERTLDRIERTFRALDETHPRAIDEVELLIELRGRYPRLFAAAEAPLSELLAAVGLAAGPRGVVPEELLESDEGPSVVGELAEHLAEDHELDDESVGAVLGIYRATLLLQNRAMERSLAAFHRALDEDAEATDRADDADAADADELVGEPDLAAVFDELAAAGEFDELADDLAIAFAETEATAAVIEDVLGDDPLSADALLVVLDRVRPTSKARSVRANVAWLRARALELVAEDHGEVERELRRVVESDPDHGPAIYDLALLTADKGQAGAALGLLRQLDGPGVGAMVDLYRRYAEPGPTSAGRNDPCPCGSGRKHKVCCAPRGGWPLQERIPWVTQKLLSFCGSPRVRSVVSDLAHASGTVEAGESELDSVGLHLAVFEAEVLEELCDVRGPLLPADELELLRGWSRTRAGVYEIVAADPDTGRSELLDLRTGERTVVTDGSLARNLPVGTAVLAWLTEEVDRTTPFHSVVRVPDQYRASLLELLDGRPSAWELAAWLRGLYAPPRLATTAGDALVSIARTYRVPDGAAARRALAAELEEDPGTGLLHAFEERDGQRWLKGSIEVEGDELTVRVMSLPRAVWFEELLERVVPGAELVDEERLPADELFADDGADVGAAAGEGDDDGGRWNLEELDPEERAEIEQQIEAMMVRYEDDWVDTPLPALDGVSPREAVADPTRRDQVLRLLDELQATADTWTAPGRGMDPQRLRALLGLT